MIEQAKFIAFTRLQLSTGDYDAHIPFLKSLSSHMCDEDRAWLGLLYMAFYNEASAWMSMTQRGTLYPIEQQRRNLYGGRIHGHLAELRVRCPWAERLRACRSWRDLRRIIEKVPGNGRWASYTTAELLMNLLELPIMPDSYEILESSGPQRGLRFLGLEPSEFNCALVMGKLEQEGIELSVSQLESILCDWAGMNKGTFYAGRNIDRQQGRIDKVMKLIRDDEAFHELWLAREVFPDASRGERCGWLGIDTRRLKAYKETGQVLAPWENRT